MAPNFGLSLADGPAQFRPSAFDRPEKVQRHYVEAIGGSVALPAFCDTTYAWIVG